MGFKPRLRLLLCAAALTAGCQRDALPGVVSGDGGGTSGGARDLAGDSGVPDPGDGMLPAIDMPMPARVPCPERIPGPSLLELRQAMLGSWRGAASNPWSADYQVEVTFSAGGGYSAHTVGGGPVAFYYGLDQDHAAKKWNLIDILDNGDGLAEIWILFNAGGAGDTNQGALEHVRACQDASGDRLDFEFWATWSGRYGPVKFRLTRR